MATNIRNMIINLENAVHQKEAQIRQLKNEIKDYYESGGNFELRTKEELNTACTRVVTLQREIVQHEREIANLRQDYENQPYMRALLREATRLPDDITNIIKGYFPEHNEKQGKGIKKRKIIKGKGNTALRRIAPSMVSYPTNVTNRIIEELKSIIARKLEILESGFNYDDTKLAQIRRSLIKTRKRLEEEIAAEIVRRNLAQESLNVPQDVANVIANMVSLGITHKDINKNGSY